MVRAAVAETLAKVCADYPLDYVTLLRRYEQDVVSVCCSACVTAGFQQCEASTKSRSRRRCTRRAVLGGYCGLHTHQWTDRVQQAKRVEAYTAKLSKKTAKATKVPMAQPDVRALL